MKKVLTAVYTVQIYVPDDYAQDAIESMDRRVRSYDVTADIYSAVKWSALNLSPGSDVVVTTSAAYSSVPGEPDGALPLPNANPQNGSDTYD